MSDLEAGVRSLLAERPGLVAPHGAVLAVDEGFGAQIVGIGVSDIDSGEPMTERTAHDLASVSKVLTTVALMRLVDAGSLSLDTTLGVVFGQDAHLHADRTVRQLLQHRAGLWEWWPLYLDPIAVEHPIAAVLARPPRYAPDQGRHYSDLGFQLLGAVVEAVTGMPFASSIRELVLEPAGMTSTWDRLPSGVAVAATSDGDAIEFAMVTSRRPYPVEDTVTAFDGWRTRTLRGEVNDGNAFHAYHGAAGHAGWFSTAADLSVLASLLASDADAHGLWRRETFAAFLAPGPDAGQVLGFRRYASGALLADRAAFGHPGFTGCAIVFAPATADADSFSAAIATNRLHGRPAPRAEQLVPAEQLFRDALAVASAPRRTHLEVRS